MSIIPSGFFRRVFYVYTKLLLHPMINKLSGWDDTIVALSTPPGVGAIGVIRLSGTEALNIVDSLFSRSIRSKPSHTAHVGYLQHLNEVIDEVVVTIYKAPRSYTGENVVEISCHGSPFIHQQVIDACVSLGARLAKPGEFTQRAFLAGKIDLTQAEAVADLINSNTKASLKTALHTVRGGFASTLKILRDQLLKFSALIELELDFSEEDVAFADRDEFKKLTNDALSQTSALLDSFKLGNVIKKGVSVAIIGRPNAGKSTLLNALLNEDRAIVSDIPGTTRDTVEEVLNIEGVLFRLIDTAGIRSHTTDVIESAGIEKSLEKMRQADLVLYLFDASQTDGEEIEKIEKQLQCEGLVYLLVVNKMDVFPPGAAEEKLKSGSDLLFIAARSGEGLPALKNEMVKTVLGDKINTENVVVTNARHYHALQKVHASLLDIQKGLDTVLPGDLLALDVRQCLYYLGEITGEITNEDQLDYIFSKFCIGK